MTESNEAITKVMSRAYPPIIMTLEDVADVCGLSLNYVRNEVQHQPHFPLNLIGLNNLDGLGTSSLNGQR